MMNSFLRSILCCAVLTCWSLAAAGQETVLGKIDFPNTGSTEAQTAFLNGVRMLHSFEWEDAADAFQEAQGIDPDFALAYWGEALSHSGGHHFPANQDMAEARAALRKLGANRKARLDKAGDERERMYLDSVEELFGQGDIKQRSVAYAEALQKLTEAYPEDLEAAAFHALSLMRTEVRGSASQRVDMQAGAIAQRIFRDNPDHPGAAHYIIHSYDDPVHAPIALYAAHKYAEIAPAAVHALHMPAHIFVQHGMWDYVAGSNEASYQASADRAKRKGLPPTRHSFHALYWLEYAYLQQGRYEKAKECLDEITRIAAREDAAPRLEETRRRMQALYTVETENWKQENVSAILDQIGGDAKYDRRTATAVLLASGMSAAHLGKMDSAKQALDGITRIHESMIEDETTSGRNQIAISKNELAASISAASGQTTEALRLMAEAVEVAETMEPPSGPPGESATDSPLKPPLELYGELLLSDGKNEQALEHFEASLRRTQARSRSLLGAARAAAAAHNDKLARRYYESLVNIGGAEADLPGRAEAEKYLAASASEQ